MEPGHRGGEDSPGPEMDGSLKLIILSGVMLFGSYLAGNIPLFISLSEEKLQVSYHFILFIVKDK